MMSSWTILMTIGAGPAADGAPDADAAVTKLVAEALEKAAKLHESGEPEQALGVLRGATRDVKKAKAPGDPSLLPIYDLAADILVETKQHEKAESLLRKIVGMRERIFDEGDSEQAEPLGNAWLLLSRSLSSAGKLEPALLAAKQAVVVLDTAFGPSHEATTKAREAVREALAAFDELLGPDDPATLKARTELTTLQESLGQYPEAIASRQRNLDAMRKKLGEDHPDVLAETGQLSRLLLVAGRAKEAIAGQERALAAATANALKAAAAAEEPPETAMASREVIDASRMLGELHVAAEQFTTAERILGKRLSDDRARIGEDHPETVLDRLLLIDLAHRRGRAGKEAADTGRLADRLLEFEGDARATATAVRGLLLAADLLVRHGDPSKARKWSAKAISLKEDPSGDKPGGLVEARTSLGAALVAMEDYAEAIPLLEEAVWEAERSFGPGDVRTLAAVSLLAECFVADDDRESAAYLVDRVLDRRVPRPDTMFEADLAAIVDETAAAAPLREKFIALRREQFGDDHPNAALAMLFLGQARASAGDFEAASTWYEQARKIQEKALGGDHPEVAATLLASAEARRRGGNLKEAGENATTSLGIWEKKAGPRHPGTLAAIGTLARIRIDEEKPADAIALLVRLREGLEKEGGGTPGERARVLIRLADLQAREGDKAGGLAAADAAAGLDCWEPTSSADEGEVESLAVALTALSKVYGALGEDAKATSTLRKARGLATQCDNPRRILDRIDRTSSSDGFPEGVFE